MNNMMSDYYYSLRDTAYDAWDDNYLRSWAEKAGLIKPPAEAKRDEQVHADNFGLMTWLKVCRYFAGC